MSEEKKMEKEKNLFCYRKKQHTDSVSFEDDLVNDESIRSNKSFNDNLFCSVGSPTNDGFGEKVVDTRYSSSKLDDFKYVRKELDQNKKKSRSTMKLVKSISDLAVKRDISLRMFENLLQIKVENNIQNTAFETACIVLLNTIKAYDLPRFVKNEKHLQRMMDGKFFLIKGDHGFKNLADQVNVKYGGIVYIIKPIKQLDISKSVLTEIYIGVTWKRLIERFIEHTEDAIESYLTNFEWPSRLIECLILKALETYLTETYLYNTEISPLNDFIKHKILGKRKWEKKVQYEKIATILYNTYFRMEVVEAHRNYETAWSRETWNINNYPLCINGKTYQGTLYPNGLNMVIPPTTPGYQTLPIYDIFFVTSLGYIGPEINEMIRIHYNIEINYRTIYSRLNKFWNNWDNLLEMSFKLVLQALLSESCYQWKEIAETLRRSPSYRVKKNFREWFFGLNVTQIRYIMKQGGFDWDNFETMAKKFKSDLSDQNTVKGIPTDVWIEWFVTDIGMKEIARKLGYKNVESFRSAWIKQGRVSIFQKKFEATYILAVKKYRKKRTVELLTDEDFLSTLLDSRLYWIYINEFDFMYWENLAVNRPSQGLRNCISFFDTLFKEEGITANILEKLTARNYTRNQELLKIIKKIISS